MTITDDQRKMLTEEVLGECYHEGHMPINCGYRCIKCGDTYVVNRTFDNDADMMDLYEAIEKDGKWDTFFWNVASLCRPRIHGIGCSETTTWLFCLNGEGYEDRCKMVAEFYGWEEKQ